MGNVTTWKFAVTTPQGVFNGELEGQIEEGETSEHAMQAVSNIVKGYLTEQGISNILACFVTDGTLHIDAPGTTLFKLDIEEEFSIGGEE